MFSRLFNRLKKFVGKCGDSSGAFSDRALENYYRIEYFNEADRIHHDHTMSTPVHRVKIQDRLGNWWYEERKFTDIYKDRFRRL